MSRQLEAFAQGSSLPPNVNGDLIGTLTVRFQSCSLENYNTFARIQFWGDPTFSDLSLSTVSTPVKPSTSSPTIEYPLIGSIHGLQNYLKDASPLRISFYRTSKCPQQNLMSSELVGFGHVQIHFLKKEGNKITNRC